MSEFTPFQFPKYNQKPEPKPPGHTWEAREFHDAISAHGKPFGVFDPERILPYRG